MISTGDTLVKCAEKLTERGVRKIYACAVHPVFANGAIDTINRSPIEKVWVTDTLPLQIGPGDERVKVLTVAPLLAEAIMRIHKDLSISALFS
jgi:ribose-phosphate pyrophosphokinase